MNALKLCLYQAKVFSAMEISSHGDFGPFQIMDVSAQLNQLQNNRESLCYIYDLATASSTLHGDPFSVVAKGS